MSRVHTLVITQQQSSPTDDPEDVRTDFDIECPGVTDACRSWGACSSADHDVNRGDGIHHSEKHIYVEGYYLIGLDRCHLASDSSMVGEAAEDLWAAKGLSAGRYKVRHTYCDGDVDTLALAEEVTL